LGGGADLLTCQIDIDLRQGAARGHLESTTISAWLGRGADHWRRARQGRKGGAWTTDVVGAGGGGGAGAAAGGHGEICGGGVGEDEGGAMVKQLVDAYIVPL
jgi:hypothetical protein